MRILSFIRLGRPHFLVGGLLLYGLGVAMARFSGAPLNWPALIWGQVAVTATQLMTHYSNDYFDLAADRVNQTPTAWSGGSRVLPEGRLPPWVALAAALFLAGLAAAAGIILATTIRPGAPPLLLTFLALALAWGYSAPPLQLHSRGLGELTTALLVPGLTPLLGFYLQATRLDWLPIQAVVPLCCLQFAMLLAIEVPDAAGDAAAGKRTLVVRLGHTPAGYLHAAILLVAYAALPLLVLLGLPQPVALAAGLLAPLAAWRAWRTLRGDWNRVACWGRLGLWSIVLLMSTALAELVAFVGLTSW
jgi:1,4-dihydroxy-2-naphthoate octaprenyltransferase